MRIILIGYGKMGQTIEKLASDKGHSIVDKFDRNDLSRLEQLDSQAADVAIEFTEPEAAVENLLQCFSKQIPVVCGTTGWLSAWEQVKTACTEKDGALFYASNFSVGVNLFFKLNRILADTMANYPAYKPAIDEIHHLQKKDAPSGTAITLAEGILAALPHLQQWHLVETLEEPKANSLPITASRKDKVPGTHVVSYVSEIDTIEIKHTAHSRLGFAMGAITAAEFLVGKKGVFGMDELLGI